MKMLGVTLAALLVSIMVTIVTVSSITTIPVVYWPVVGMAAGYVQMIQHGQTASEVSL